MQSKRGDILRSGSVCLEQRAGYKGMVMTQAETVVEINTIQASERANTDSCWAYWAHTNRDAVYIECVCFFFVFCLSLRTTLSSFMATLRCL